MLVVPNRKALVLALGNPKMVTACIPTAKQFEMHGRQLVAVPHRLDETRVLRNLGINAPSPILYHYDWPGLHVPFDVQRATAAFATLYLRGYILNDIGTGKTLSALWAIDYLRKLGAIRSVLVIAPLSTLRGVWSDEVEMNLPDLKPVILHGDKNKRRKLLAQKADVYIINHDGVHVILDDLIKRDDIDLVIIDELAQVARNSSTRRWKSLDKLINRKDRIVPAIGMTGTPRPKSPMDAWAQIRLLTKSNVPPYRNRWREMTMRQVTKFKWVAREGANEVIARAMQPAIRFERKDCVDIPARMYAYREAGMSIEQLRLFKDMQEKLKAEAERGEIHAANSAVKLGKLLQIACGVAYSTTGEELCFGSPARIEVLQELIDSAAGKVIVYVPYVSAVRYVAESLRAAGYGVGVVYGEVSAKQRDKVFAAFKTDDNMDVLVAQPAAMSHGLTLVVANTVVWFAPITSNDIFDQANGRVTRPGQRNEQYVIMLYGSGMEKRRFKILQDQGAEQDELLLAIRETDLLRA